LGPASVLASSELRDDAGSSPDLLEGETSSGARDALGSGAIPFVVMSPEDLAWFNLRPEAATLLACVNGVSSLEAVCAAANMTADEGAFLLLDLAEWGVVSFR
jgi:hypothetical protein